MLVSKGNPSASRAAAVNWTDGQEDSGWGSEGDVSMPTRECLDASKLYRSSSISLTPRDDPPAETPLALRRSSSSTSSLSLSELSSVPSDQSSGKFAKFAELVRYGGARSGRTEDIATLMQSRRHQRWSRRKARMRKNCGIICTNLMRGLRGKPIQHADDDGLEEEAKETFLSPHSMVLVQRPSRVRQGRIAKKFICPSEFSLYFTLHLTRIHKQRSTVVHFVSDNAEEVNHLPSVRVHQGSVKVTIIAAVNVDTHEENEGVAVTMTVRDRTMGASPRQSQYEPLHTGYKYRDSNPEFNCSQELPRLVEQDIIDFQVHKKNKKTGDVKLFGTAEFLMKRCHPHGFEGLLDLSCSQVPAIQDSKSQQQPSSYMHRTKSTKSWLNVKVDTDHSCMLSAEVDHGGAAAIVMSSNGVAIDQDVKVEVHLYLKQPEHAHTATSTTLGSWKPRDEMDRWKMNLPANRASMPHKHNASYQQLLEDGTYCLALLVNGELCEISVPGLVVEHGSQVTAYCCAPKDKPAHAVIDNMVLMWTNLKEKPLQRQTDQVSFNLPRKDQELIREAQVEARNIAEWRTFDSFFGCFLFANGVSIGITTEVGSRFPDQVKEGTWEAMETFFLVVFTVELVLRYWMLAGQLFKSFDWWVVWDTVVVFLGMVEHMAKSMPFPTSVTRLFRLTKLAKMVRLVRAFKALGILVQGLILSLDTMAWTVSLLLLVIFVGSVLVVTCTTGWLTETTELSRPLVLDPGWMPTEMIYDNVTNTTVLQHSPMNIGPSLKPWFKVSAAVWQLLSISMLDQWAMSIRQFAFGLEGSDRWKGMVIAAILMVLLFFTSVCLCNMVVAIMCTTAFGIISKDQRIKRANTLELRQQALTQFLALLRVLNDRPLFKSDKYVTMDELLVICREAPGKAEDISKEWKEMKQKKNPADWNLKYCMYLLELTSPDVVTLGIIFSDKGQVEMDGLIEAIAIMQLQRYQGNVKSVNEMVWGKPGVGVRPGDLFFFSWLTIQMEREINHMERNTMGVCYLTQDILSCLAERAQQSHAIFSFDLSKLDLESEIHEKIHEKPRFHRTVGTRHMVKYVSSHKADTMKSGLGLYMDLFFGMFILVNGVVIGFQAADTEGAFEEGFFIIDCIFMVVFTVELFLRASLFCCINDLYAKVDHTPRDRNGLKLSPEEFLLTRIKQLQKRIFLGMIPPLPHNGKKQVMRSFPKFVYSSSFQFFDFFIVVTCAVDLVVIAQLRRLNLVSVDPSVFAVVRMFRLVRLTKLLRIFKVFPQLQRLVMVLMNCLRLIWYTMVIMTLVLYMFAIMIIVTFDEEARHDSEKEQFYYFGGILNAMLSGWQCMSFDNWPAVTGLIIEGRWYMMPLVVSMMMCGVMLMNMAAGVLCAASVTLRTERSATLKYEALMAYIETMGVLTDLLQFDVNTDILLQEVMEEVCKMKFHKANLVFDSRHDDHLRSQVGPAMREKAKDPELISLMRKILKKAGLDAPVVKKIFEVVDYERQGFVYLRDFIIAGLMLKEDLAKIDVFACSNALRQLRTKCHNIQTELQNCHSKMEVLLHTVCHLIFWENYKPQKRTLSQDGDSAKYYKFDNDTNKALSKLANWGGQGVGPHVEQSGKFQSAQGTGKLRPIGKTHEMDNFRILQGDHTNIRKEVAIGDFLVLQPHHGSPRDSKEKPMTVKVMDVRPTKRHEMQVEMLEKGKGMVGHQDTHTIKVEWPKEYGTQDDRYAFHIIRNDNPLDEDKHKTENQQIKVPEGELSSTRSAARYLEWDIKSKQIVADRLDELEEKTLAATHKSMNMKPQHSGAKDRLLQVRVIENEDLRREQERLWGMVERLAKRRLVFEVFEAYRDYFLSKRKSPRLRSPRSPRAPAIAPADAPAISMLQLADAGQEPVQVSLKGRLGTIIWDGRKEYHQYVTIKWADDGTESDIIEADQVFALLGKDLVPLETPTAPCEDEMIRLETLAALSQPCEDERSLVSEPSALFPDIPMWEPSNESRWGDVVTELPISSRALDDALSGYAAEQAGSLPHPPPALVASDLAPESGIRPPLTLPGPGSFGGAPPSARRAAQPQSRGDDFDDTLLEFEMSVVSL